MSRWQSTTLQFDPFGNLQPTLESVLEAIRAIEAILEALLDLIKIFSLDLLNPLRAIVALLLAAIRAIINQLSNSGISLLVIHPDFSREGLQPILESVSGAYPRFETKIVGKFFDTNDLFRPTYPSGSSVAMVVFYLGADSAGDLLKILFALMRFFSTPLAFSLPPPVNIKVTPVTKGGDPVAQFERLFDSDLQKALSVEWRMPVPYTGLGAPGVFNQFGAFIRTFETPNFIVERSLTPGGKTIERSLSNSTIGKSLNQRVADTVQFVVNNKVSIREFLPGAPMQRGPVYHHFEKRFDVSGSRLVAGTLTGVFRFLDDGADLEPGQTWTYRIRSYFGDASVYINDATNNEALLSSDPNDSKFSFIRQDIIRTQLHDWLILTSNDGYIISQPSATVQAVVPEVTTASNATHIYYAIFDAIRAAILLNFEFPLPSSNSVDYERSPRNRPSYTRNEQRTGWGTLSIVAGQFIPLKKAYNDAEKLKNSILFNQICRVIANKCLVDIYNKPEISILLSEKWSGPHTAVNVSATDKLDLPPDAIQPIVQKTLREVRNENGDVTALTSFVGSPVWSFLSLPVTGTISKLDEQKINRYLSLEDSYITVGGVTLGAEPGKNRPNLTANDAPLLPGPAPLTFVTAEERSALAEFLRIALIPMTGDLGYLIWRGVTIGDLFPYFVPFIFDFEQFIKGLLQAFENAIKEIQAIIENLIQKLRLLEQILESILQLIEMLRISIRVSILGTSNTNGSAMGLINNLLSSTDKPGDSPLGLHSGIVLTAGGPGAGFIKAIEAILFIVSASESGQG